MKLLFDQNLSHHLVPALVDIYPESKHVREVGLQTADDEEVWNYAVQHEFAIVSKDSDFHQRSFLFGHPPKVIWIRLGNCTTKQIEALLRDRHQDLLAFNLDEGGSFLALT